MIRLISLCIIVFAFTTGAAKGTSFRYEYISFNEAQLPAGYQTFFTVKVIDDGRVFGTALRSGYPRGCVSICWYDFHTPTNHIVLVAGALLLDCDNCNIQTVLFRKGKEERIPTIPEEFLTLVNQLTDSGIVLLEAYDPSFKLTNYLYWRG